jgi:hypothetical protein
MKIEFVPQWRKLLRRSLALWLGCYLPLLWLLVPEILYAAFAIELSPKLVWVVAFTLATLVGPGLLINQHIADRGDR